MRPNILAGIVILILGAFVLIQGGSFSSKRDVLKVGDLKITATEEETIPSWVGWIAVLGGAALLLAGTRKRA